VYRVRALPAVAFPSFSPRIFVAAPRTPEYDCRFFGGYFAKEHAMKVVVCVKRVPDTETRIRIAGDGKSIDHGETNFVLNPYDEYAVEEAVQLKENAGAEVTVLSYGPEEATKEIRTALAMGADAGVLIKDAAALTRDSFAVATVLAQALRSMEFDLLFFGKQAVDDDNAAVGPMVAGLLDLPCVSAINKFEQADGTVTVQRDVEGGTEVITSPMPLVLTAQKGLNDPRLPALKGIMKAKKKKIEELEPQGVEDKVEILSLVLPPERQGGKVVGEGPDAAPELVRLLKDEAKVL
jgi:electron transfer flavoprotein beta subunit